MTVVTRNNANAAIAWFTRNRVEYELTHTSSTELFWAVPESARNLIRDWFAHDDFVLWFN